MNMIQRFIQVVAVALCFTVAGVAFADKPTTKPTKRTGPPAALTKAIADLSKQFADFAAKPDSAPLATNSEYFKSGLPEDVTVDDIINALDSRMSGPPSQAAFVKWQLLSGCPSKFDGAQAGRIFNIYRNAPQPMQRFSADPRSHPQLDRAIQGMKDGQQANLNEQVDNQKKPVDLLNKPILEYRDALYDHLPTTVDTLIARLQDAAVRVPAGVDINGLVSGFGADVKSWLTVDANPAQVNALLAVLKDVQKTKSTVVYDSADWDPDQKKMTWKTTPAGFDAKACQAIDKSLKDYLVNPQGSSLQFKK